MIRPRLWNRADPDRPRKCRSIMRGTSLGNPFIRGIHGSRDEVIAKCEIHYRESEHLMRMIAALDDEDLMCCCRPMTCHGDIVLKIWDEINGVRQAG